MHFFCLLLFASHVCDLAAIISFYDRDSSIELLGTSTLQIVTGTLKPVTGSILKEPGASIIGSKFYFDNGVLTDGDFSILLTATYDPTLTTSIVLYGSTGSGKRDAGYFVFNPGFIPHKVLVRGFRNRIEGLTSFVNSDAISLYDTQSTLTLSLQRKLDQDIVMNGGSIVIDDDLELDDFIILDGPGQVYFETNNVILGTKDLTWTSTIVWHNGENLNLNSTQHIYGQWIFQGDAHIFGDDNTLDLSHGGTIWVKKNTKLRLSSIKINGLGSGSFVLEDKTSQLELFRCGIDLDRTYNFTNGGVIVKGPSAVVCRDKFLYFSQLASLTVDGIHFLYDTLNFLDRDNIRTFTEIGTNNYGFINGGVIRRVVGDKVGDFNYYGNANIDNNTMVTRRKNLIIHDNTTLNGEGQILSFSRLANEPIVLIKPGKRLSFTEILLKDFPVVHVEQPVGSRLVFDNDTTVELGENGYLNSVWEFKGLVLFNGANKTIEFGPQAKFVIRPGSSVYFDNLTLRGVTANKLILYDNTSTVSFGNVTWIQDGSYSFTQSKFDIVGKFSIEGTGTFTMGTAKPCTLQSFGQLAVNRNTSFLYAPTIANRDLFVMTGTGSTLYLAGGTLASTTTGLRLKRGTLLVDSKSYIFNTGSAVSQGISLGNGIASQNLIVKLEPAATLELLSGVLTYENVG